jgi:hypothetical protein
VKKRRPKPKGRHKPASAGKREGCVMTVALIREPKQLNAVEVAFSESARFYRLLRANPKFENILTKLREAKEKQRSVRVLMESPEGNTINDVDTTG